MNHWIFKSSLFSQYSGVIFESIWESKLIAKYHICHVWVNQGNKILSGKDNLTQICGVKTILLCIGPFYLWDGYSLTKKLPLCGCILQRDGVICRKNAECVPFSNIKWSMFFSPFTKVHMYAAAWPCQKWLYSGTSLRGPWDHENYCYIRFLVIIGFKNIYIKSWDQQNYLVIRGFVISDLFITRFHCIVNKN